MERTDPAIQDGYGINHTALEYASAGGLPQPKTVRVGRTQRESRQRPRVRRPSAAERVLDKGLDAK